MYTCTREEKEKLNAVIAAVVMPAIQRAVMDASRALVYEVEGFHPDIAYGTSMSAAADEITARLCDYFAGVCYRREEGIYETITAKDLQEWLNEQIPAR